MTKYRHYFNLMLQKHTPLFQEFESIHNQYVLDPIKHQDTFNHVGVEVRDVITEYENRLCHHSEKGVYAKYSHHLSDKFWELVRAKFPRIDDVGIEVAYNFTPPSTHRRPSPPPKPQTILDSSPDDIIQDALDETLNRLKKISL
jgi:hypothetical protein